MAGGCWVGLAGASVLPLVFAAATVAGWGCLRAIVRGRSVVFRHDVNGVGACSARPSLAPPAVALRRPGGGHLGWPEGCPNREPPYRAKGRALSPIAGALAPDDRAGRLPGGGDRRWASASAPTPRATLGTFPGMTLTALLTDQPRSGAGPRRPDGPRPPAGQLGDGGLPGRLHADGPPLRPARRHSAGVSGRDGVPGRDRPVAPTRPSGRPSARFSRPGAGNKPALRPRSSCQRGPGAPRRFSPGLEAIAWPDYGWRSGRVDGLPEWPMRPARRSRAAKRGTSASRTLIRIKPGPEVGSRGSSERRRTVGIAAPAPSSIDHEAAPRHRFEPVGEPLVLGLGPVGGASASRRTSGCWAGPAHHSRDSSAAGQRHERWSGPQRSGRSSAGKIG